MPCGIMLTVYLASWDKALLSTARGTLSCAHVTVSLPGGCRGRRDGAGEAVLATGAPLSGTQVDDHCLAPLARG